MLKKIILGTSRILFKSFISTQEFTLILEKTLNNKTFKIKRRKFTPAAFLFLSIIPRMVNTFDQ